MTDASVNRMAELPPAIRYEVTADIQGERDAQHEKWGEQNHDDSTWSLILGEEVGEVCLAILEERFGDSERSHANVREELVQVAAVAVAWIEAIDRRATR